MWEVKSFFLGQQPSSSPLQLRGTFALVVCWLVEVGPLLLGGNWCMVLGLGWVARWPPYTGFQLSRPVWRALGYGAMCTSEVNPTGWKNMPQGPSCRLAHRAGVISCEAPLLVVSRGEKEVVGGAKKEGQGEGFHSHQVTMTVSWPQLLPSSSMRTAWLGQQQWPLSSLPRSSWVLWWLCLYGSCCPRGRTIDAGYFLSQLFQWLLWSGGWPLLLA